MKRVRGLMAEPPKLAEYRKALDARQEPHDYNTFRDYRDPDRADEETPYSELKLKLYEAQHGLCAYCEISVRHKGGPFQVEHYRPKSGGLKRHLDFQNLLGCCEGGVNPYHERHKWHYFPPAKTNRSCGARKEDQEPSVLGILDPRKIPLLPSGPALPAVVTVDDEGVIEPNEEGCKAVGIEKKDVQETLDKLGLNVPRLKLARKNLWDALKKNEPDLNVELITDQLAPSADKANTRVLREFWSTRRCFLNSFSDQPNAAEAWLATDEAKAALC
jgi:uncharacterized protein (TIGR02646 family)